MASSSRCAIFRWPSSKGSFVTLLGPSGCGKTTILRAIAGLVDISSGQISIGGRRVDDVPIYKRNIGLVFQNYALFPHKNVFDNVAFGLKYRNVPKAEIERRVGQALDMVRLPGSEKKLPSQLSGGQQQRIALARAIVFEPDSPAARRAAFGARCQHARGDARRDQEDPESRPASPPSS